MGLVPKRRNSISTTRCQRITRACPRPHAVWPLPTVEGAVSDRPVFARSPSTDAGLLLLGGLDRHTLGADWHEQVALAPLFHENHILSGSLAFNVLMGRTWPAREADLAEARAICERLGLGTLLERMPAGLMQQVGETGWQLSHGERSRVFLARALLQRAPLTILDESFAALDPETLRICLETARAETNALIVIAHP
ncbi:MAG: ATP-binding cassette domain-containing protein [Burkholderiaceae bacterium]